MPRSPFFRPQVQQRPTAVYRQQPGQQNFTGPAGEPPAGQPTDPATPPTPPAPPVSNPDPDEAALGEAGQRALDRIKTARDTEKTGRITAEAALTTAQTEHTRVLGEKDTRIAELAPKAELADKYAVALDKGLPRHLADRLRGTTIAELEADADQLVPLLAGTTGPRPMPHQGPKPPTKITGVHAGAAMYEAEQAARRPVTT